MGAQRAHFTLGIAESVETILAQPALDRQWLKTTVSTRRDEKQTHGVEVMTERCRYHIDSRQYLDCTIALVDNFPALDQLSFARVGCGLSVQSADYIQLEFTPVRRGRLSMPLALASDYGSPGWSGQGARATNFPRVAHLLLDSRASQLLQMARGPPSV